MNTHYSVMIRRLRRIELIHSAFLSHSDPIWDKDIAHPACIGISDVEKVLVGI